MKGGSHGHQHVSCSEARIGPLLIQNEFNQVILNWCCGRLLAIRPRARGPMARTAATTVIKKLFQRLIFARKCDLPRIHNPQPWQLDHLAIHCHFAGVVVNVNWVTNAAHPTD